MKLSTPALLGLIYVTSEVLLTITKRASHGGASRDANSWRLLWAIITLSICLGIFAARRFPMTSVPYPKQLATMGVAVFVVGLALRAWSVVCLGRFFTVNVAIAPDHQLVESGPYRFVRHPSYTGALLAILGLALTLGNWLTIIIIMFPICGVFVYRMNVEERALIDGLGEKYVSYTSRTKRLVPFVY